MEIKQVNVKQGLYLFADTDRCIHHGQVSIPVITLLNFFFYTWSAHMSLVHYSVVSQQRSSSMLADAETPLSCWDYLNWFLCNLALFLQSPVQTGSSQMVGCPGFGWSLIASSSLVSPNSTTRLRSGDCKGHSTHNTLFSDLFNQSIQFNYIVFI